MQYPLKSMSLGEILDTAFRVFTHNFISLAGIAVVLQAIAFGIAFLIASSGTSTWAAVIAILIPMLIVSPLTTAVSTKIIADRYLGLSTGVGSAFSFALRILFPLLGAVLVAGLITGIGLLFLLIPGIYFMLRFSLVAPATVVEQRGGTAALRRSSELVKGGYGKFFFLILILSIIGIVIQLTVTAMLGEESLMSIFMSQGVAAILGAYGATVWTIAYFERRCAKEGFDLQVLAEALGAEDSYESAQEFEEDTAEDDWGTEA